MPLQSPPLPPQHWPSPEFLFKATKALPLVYTSVMPVKVTELQSPPYALLPQQVMVPAVRSKATKAPMEAMSSVTSPRLLPVKAEASQLPP